MGRRARWVYGLLALAVCLGGALLWGLLRPRVLPLGVEQRLLAGQMGLDASSFQPVPQEGGGVRAWRVWYYAVPRPSIGGPPMVVQTRGSRVEVVMFMGYYPTVGVRGNWASPVDLAGTAGWRISRSYALPPGAVAPATERAAADMAVMATAAVLGLSTVDRQGRTFTPRLDWTGVPLFHPEGTHLVVVELRFQRPGRALPHVVECMVSPATRQVGKVHVSRW